MIFDPIYIGLFLLLMVVYLGWTLKESAKAQKEIAEEEANAAKQAASKEEANAPSESTKEK